MIHIWLRCPKNRRHEFFWGGGILWLWQAYLRMFITSGGLWRAPRGCLSRLKGPKMHWKWPKWPLARKNQSALEKLINKLHFWTGPTVQGWIKELSLIWQYLKNSRPQGGPKMAKKAIKMNNHEKNEKKNEKNSKLRSFFGLVPRPEGEFRA